MATPGKRPDKVTMSLLNDCTTVTFKASSSRSKVAKLMDTPPFKVIDIENVAPSGWVPAGGKPMSEDKQARCFIITLQGERKYYLELSTKRTRDIMADGFDLMIQKMKDGAWPPQELGVIESTKV
jgi:hypothetical protein